MVVVQQVSYAAQLLSRTLQGFDLFPQPRLFGLLFAQHLVDVLHNEPS